MKWMVRNPGGDAVGPVTEEQLARAMDAGKISTDVEVAAEGANTWMPLLVAIPDFGKTTAGVAKRAMAPSQPIIEVPPPSIRPPALQPTEAKHPTEKNVGVTTAGVDPVGTVQAANGGAAPANRDGRVGTMVSKSLNPPEAEPPLAGKPQAAPPRGTPSGYSPVATATVPVKASWRLWAVMGAAAAMAMGLGAARWTVPTQSPERLVGIATDALKAGDFSRLESDDSLGFKQAIKAEVLKAGKGELDRITALKSKAEEAGKKQAVEILTAIAEKGKQQFSQLTWTEQNELRPEAKAWVLRNGHQATAPQFGAKMPPLDALLKEDVAVLGSWRQSLGLEVLTAEEKQAVAELDALKLNGDDDTETRYLIPTGRRLLTDRTKTDFSRYPFKSTMVRYEGPVSRSLLRSTRAGIHFTATGEQGFLPDLLGARWDITRGDSGWRLHPNLGSSEDKQEQSQDAVAVVVGKTAAAVVSGRFWAFMAPGLLLSVLLIGRWRRNRTQPVFGSQDAAVIGMIGAVAAAQHLCLLAVGLDDWAFGPVMCAAVGLLASRKSVDEGAQLGLLAGATLYAASSLFVVPGAPEVGPPIAEFVLASLSFAVAGALVAKGAVRWWQPLPVALPLLMPVLLQRDLLTSVDPLGHAAVAVTIMTGLLAIRSPGKVGLQGVGAII